VTITDTIEKITTWAAENICKGITLKVPDDDVMDADKNLTLADVNPAAWPILVPVKSSSPIASAPTIPSLCVQVLPPASDNMKDGKRIVPIRFTLSAWNPGKYWIDTFSVSEKDAKGPGLHMYSRGDEDAREKGFVPAQDGWRDVYNFLDISLAALEKADVIGNGIRILHEEGIEWGPFEDEQKNLLDFYPYWFLWLSFKAEIGLIRTREDIAKFL
jgi:hypothetical protein